MTVTASDITIQKLLPVLVYVQTHLAFDLSLEILADMAHLSPFHFHRLFKLAVGETVKQYVQRLRLDKAAYQLIIRNASILEVALSVGFNTHETFSRAFKKKFKITPQQYRKNYSFAYHLETGHSAQLLNKFARDYELSKLTVQRLKPINVAFIRNIGPYTEVDATLYERLVAWAKQNNIYSGDNLLIGIGHDAPNITPANKLRFDACLQVPTQFNPEGDIGFQTIPAGYYATVSYTGPFGPTLEQAYFEMFQQFPTLKGYELIGLPAIEIYRTTHINKDFNLNHTDIYLPVEKSSH